MYLGAKRRYINTLPFLSFLFQENLGKLAPENATPIWILIKPELMQWQWHQLDNMQIICSLLHTDKHDITSSLNFLQARCSS